MQSTAVGLNLLIRWGPEQGIVIFEAIQFHTIVLKGR